MKKIMIALIVVISIMSFSTKSVSAQTVVIKNGNTLTSYSVRYYNESPYGIKIDTFTGTDVSTLKYLEIPEDAWPLFANNSYLVFSLDAFKAQTESNDKENRLSDADYDLQVLKGQKNTLFLIFCITLIVLVASNVLWLAYHAESRKKFKALQAANLAAKS